VGRRRPRQYLICCVRLNWKPPPFADVLWVEVESLGVMCGVSFVVPLMVHESRCIRSVVCDQLGIVIFSRARRLNSGPDNCFTLGEREVMPFPGT
jgi:hypothetical protein